MDKESLAICTFDETITVETIEKNPLKTQNSLALALTKPKQLEFVIEKGTELGINCFYLFPSQKSKLRHLSSSKQERLKKILISALKQSKRLHLPKIHILDNKERLPKDQNYLLADFKGIQFSHSNNAQTFIIGPESGFTEEEISFFKNNLKATGVILSDAVLRAETAALCAATLLAHFH